MIIGFGKTETDIENSFEKAFIDEAKRLYMGQENNAFSDDMIAAIKTWADRASKESQEMADSFKDAAEYPDRYTRFWCYVLGDCNHICLIVSFHHINRRHAFSPDGWAMLQSKRIFEIDYWECGRSQKAKAA